MVTANALGSLFAGTCALHTRACPGSACVNVPALIGAPLVGISHIWYTLSAGSGGRSATLDKINPAKSLRRRPSPSGFVWPPNTPICCIGRTVQRAPPHLCAPLSLATTNRSPRLRLRLPSSPRLSSAPHGTTLFLPFSDSRCVRLLQPSFACHTYLISVPSHPLIPWNAVQRRTPWRDVNSWLRF